VFLEGTDTSAAEGVLFFCDAEITLLMASFEGWEFADAKVHVEVFVRFFFSFYSFQVVSVDKVEDDTCYENRKTDRISIEL